MSTSILSVRQIIYLVVYQLAALLCTFLTILGWFNLYKYRNSMFVHKRNKLVLKLSLSAFFAFEIIAFIQGNIVNIYKEASMVLNLPFYHILFFCIYIGLIPSYWLRLYEYRFANEIKDVKWITIINRVVYLDTYTF